MWAWCEQGYQTPFEWPRKIESDSISLVWPSKCITNMFIVIYVLIYKQSIVSVQGYLTGLHVQCLDNECTGVFRRITAKMRHSPSSGLMFGQRRRRWPSIEPELDEGPDLLGRCIRVVDTGWASRGPSFTLVYIVLSTRTVRFENETQIQGPASPACLRSPAAL